MAETLIVKTDNQLSKETCYNITLQFGKHFSNLSTSVNMECDYRVVSNEDVAHSVCEKLTWILFLRQLFIASGAWMMFFLCGLYLGSPTVIIPQLRKEANSTDAVSVEMASWLSSISSYGMIPWELILPAILCQMGRKITCIVSHLGIIVASITFYCSSTTTHLFIFELVQGLPYAGILTTSTIIIAEYTSPEYRGLFLALKGASVCWGIWVANTIGTFVHWRYISIFGFVCSLYTLTVFFWPESPFWLATKGRFEECKVAHRWLKGNSVVAEKELEGLINSQTRSHKFLKRHFFKTLVSKSFYRPVLLSTLTVALYHFSGRLVYCIYALDVIKKITGDESAAYVGMLILDGFTVFSMYIGSILVKSLKRRTILLTTSFGMITFLFILSLYLYLVHLYIISEHKYLSISLLTGFSMFASSGPTLLALLFYGELIPLRHKSFAVVIITLVFSILQSTLIKVSPYIFNSFKIHGAFLFYAICSSILTFLVYKYLPETKDKTLQEIEDMFKGLEKEETGGNMETTQLHRVNSI